MARFCNLVARTVDAAIDITLIGGERLNHTKLPVVFAANHRSLADLWVGLTVFHRLGVYPGILFNRKFLPGPLAPFASGAGVILVDKGGTVKAGTAALRSGRNLMVMPEGHLYFDPNSPHEPDTFRSGLAVMAHEANVPIVPIAVSGTERAWPPGRGPKLTRKPKHAVTVQVGSPVETEGDPVRDAHQVRAAVAAMLARARACP